MGILGYYTIQSTAQTGGLRFMLNLSKKITFIFVTSLLVLTIPLLQAATQTNHAVNFLDQVINKGQNQLTLIHTYLTSIAALIKKDKVYPKKEKDKIIKHFLQLDREIIERLQKQKFIQVSPEQAHCLLQINNTLINHINTLVQTNFKGIDSFDPQNLFKKALQTRSMHNLQNIFKQLQLNDQKLEILMKKALGLTWYNQISRQFDDWIISPCQKYSIPQRTLFALGSTFFASGVMWHMYHQTFRKWMVGTDGPMPADDKPSAMRSFLRTIYVKGYGPKIGRGGKEIEVEYTGQDPGPTSSDLGLLGRINAFAFEWDHRMNWIGTFTGGLLGLYLMREFKENIYPAAKKYSQVIKNWLKGGVFLEEAKRAAEKVDPVFFKDIYGQNEIKRYMQLIVEYLKEPETLDRLGLTPPKGILCIGDTRTGKTFMISALFGEINEMLKQTNQTGKFKLLKLDVLSIKVEGMEKILRHVRQNAPCIVFIDEIDLLDLQRTGENRTLSEFLTAMSDAIGSKDSKRQVIIIAATNRPETLDVALRQPGRFGKELRFEYPNFTDRYKYIKGRLKELSLTCDQFDIQKLAQYTENKSYEALNMLIKNAIIKARLRNEVLSQDHLNEALDEDIYHIIPAYTKNIPNEELRILASHFAGQALLLALFDNNIHLAKVTIKQVMTELKEEVMGMHLYNDKKEQQRFEYGRIFTHNKYDSINLNTKEEKIELCKMYLAGFIAEELLLGTCGYSCHADDDKANALGLAQSIAFEGLDIANMPKNIQKQKQEEALAIIEQCKKETRELLQENKAILQTLSEVLLRNQTLDYDEVRAIITNHEQISAQLKEELAHNQTTSATTAPEQTGAETPPLAA